MKHTLPWLEPGEPFPDVTQASGAGAPAPGLLAAGGALGVARMLRLLRDELEIAMALTGCRTLAEAGAHLLDPATAAVWEQAGPR